MQAVGLHLFREKFRSGKRCSSGALAVLLALATGGCPGPKSQSPSPSPSPSPAPSITPAPTPLPQTFIPYSRMETAKLFNGFDLHATVSSSQGDIAVLERRVPEAYVLNLDVSVRVPEAAHTLEQLQTSDPRLSELLPGLLAALPQAKVSSFYHALYELKVNSLDHNLSRLELLLSRHNFFDCNTILEITSQPSNRKVLLIQSDMDVNADGSDSDRNVVVDGSSLNFQPFTSYRWLKRTPIPSQFIPERESKLKQWQTELADRTTTSERRRVLQEQISGLNREIADLKKYSFLISKTDPFIVLPGFMLREPKMAFAPKLGDYAVVLYRGVFYPALLGDVGPSYKMGEASLRIASELDPRVSAYNRPETDLDITYLVFPGSGDSPPGPPDLKRLHERCAQLLQDIGGATGRLWDWPDITVSPSPSPSGSLGPAASPTPLSSLAPAGPPSPRASDSLVPSPKKDQR